MVLRILAVHLCQHAETASAKGNGNDGTPLPPTLHGVTNTTTTVHVRPVNKFQCTKKKKKKRGSLRE